MYRVGICATSLCALPAAPFYQFRQVSASAGSARVYLKETNWFRPAFGVFPVGSQLTTSIGH
jgi:hypothetical protein